MTDRLKKIQERTIPPEVRVAEVYKLKEILDEREWLIEKLVEARKEIKRLKKQRKADIENILSDKPMIG